jgi:aldehyde oxidoreductase
MPSRSSSPRRKRSPLKRWTKIKVDYKPLPPVLTMEDALKPDAPKIHAEGNVLGEKHLRKGDAPAAMRDADVVVEDMIQTQTVDHAFLDIEAGRARYDGKHADH